MWLFFGLFFGFATHVLADQVVITKNDDVDAQTTTSFARNIKDSLYSTRFGDVTWDNDAWTLTATAARPDDYRGISFVANGYIGTSMASNGPFVQTFEQHSGWPLLDQRQTFSTVSGFFDRQPKTEGTNFDWLYQYGWDSVISGIPAWSPLIIDLGNDTYLDANTSLSQLSNIVLTQDYRKGIARWQYLWTPMNLDNLTLDITYTALAHKLHVNRAYVQLQVSASRDINFTAVNVIDGFQALRTESVETGTEESLIYSAVQPLGVDNVTAWVYTGLQSNSSSTLTNITDKPYIIGNDSSIAQGLSIQIRSGQTTTITKFVGIASTDAFQDPRSQARNSINDAISEGFTTALQSHSQEWAAVFPTTSVSNYSDPETGKLPQDPVLIEKTIVQVVSAFSMLTNTISKNAYNLLTAPKINVNGISVCGLLTDCYAGQRFWDQDVWMKPYLDAVFPFAAKQITNNRVEQYPQALRNAQTAYTSSQNGTTFSDNAAIYAWTTGRDANCTATGPCWDYEYHLNGDIAHSFTTIWAASGDTQYFKGNLLPVMNSIATMFSELLEKNGSKYYLNNLTDPDEYANGVDNGGFTMPLIASVFKDTNWFNQLLGNSENATWEEQATNIEIPRIGDISLEYSDMNGTIEVKQADVVLKIYPLDVQDDYTTESQLADLDYYAGKQSADGPAMTYAIFSIGATDISPSGCAGFTYDQSSWSPYVRAPFFFFSENLVDGDSSGQQNGAYPFLTGHGGMLQVDLFGYLGLRYSANFTIRINPTLPPQIKHITFPVFYHQGWPINAVSNTTHTVLTRLSEPLSTANTTFASAPLSIAVGRATTNNQTFIQLPPNGTITVENSLALYNKTTPNDVLQCGSGVSYQEYVPGRFPSAAIDGAISTLWQSSNASTPSTLTVDLSATAFQRIANMSFDWAQSPPSNATVIFHNQTDPMTSPGRFTIQLNNINISAPFDVDTANQVDGYKSNKTFVDLAGKNVWSGNYASLIVQGNQNASDATVGAQVADWSVVGEL